MDYSEELTNEYEGTLVIAASRTEVLKFDETLPAMPDSARNIMGLAYDLNTDMNRIAVAISGDPALATAVLKLANSSMFGRQMEVNDVGQALGVIGLTNLKTLVLVKAVYKLNTSPTLADRLVRANSLGTAVALAMFGERTFRLDTDSLFLYGILHRLGQMVMLAHPEVSLRYHEVLERIAENGESFVTAELHVFGFSHPLIGALVGRRWNLPLELCDAMLHVHGSGVKEETPVAEITNLVRLADMVALAAGFGAPENLPIDRCVIMELGVEAGVFNDGTSAELDQFIAELIDKVKAARFIWPG